MFKGGRGRKKKNTCLLARGQQKSKNEISIRLVKKISRTPEKIAAKNFKKRGGSVLLAWGENSKSSTSVNDIGAKIGGPLETSYATKEIPELEIKKNSKGYKNGGNRALAKQENI